MYLGMLLGLMLILPIVSTIGEAMMVANSDIWLLAAKWFVFWGVGVRLALAGLRQMARPEFTARDILGIKDPAAQKVVRELGFANLSIGAVALLSLFWPSWVMPAAVAGGLFLGLAGVQHVRNSDRGAKENQAMVSDLFLAAVLAVLVGHWLFWP